MGEKLTSFPKEYRHPDLDVIVSDESESTVFTKCIVGTKGDIDYKVNEFIATLDRKPLGLTLCRGWEKGEVIAMLSVLTYEKSKEAGERE